MNRWSWPFESILENRVADRSVHRRCGATVGVGDRAYVLGEDDGNSGSIESDRASEFNGVKRNRRWCTVDAGLAAVGHESNLTCGRPGRCAHASGEHDGLTHGRWIWRVAGDDSRGGYARSVQNDSIARSLSNGELVSQRVITENLYRTLARNQTQHTVCIVDLPDNTAVRQTERNRTRRVENVAPVPALDDKIPVGHRDNASVSNAVICDSADDRIERRHHAADTRRAVSEGHRADVTNRAVVPRRALHHIVSVG